MQKYDIINKKGDKNMKTEYGDEVNVPAGILCIVGALIVSGLFVTRVAQEIHKHWTSAPQKIVHQEKRLPPPALTNCNTRQ